MVSQFTKDCVVSIKEKGIPWTVVSKKTGISYGRLRTLQSGKVEPTFSEFVALAAYCGFDFSFYIEAAKNEQHNQAS